jgi:hypothetical protein
MLFWCTIALTYLTTDVSRILGDIWRSMLGPLSFVSMAAQIAAYRDMLDTELGTSRFPIILSSDVPNCFLPRLEKSQESDIIACTTGIKTSSNNLAEAWCAPYPGGNYCNSTFIPANLFARNVFRDQFLSYLADPCEMLQDYDQQIIPQIERLYERSNRGFHSQITGVVAYWENFIYAADLRAECTRIAPYNSKFDRFRFLQNRIHYLIINNEINNTNNVVLNVIIPKR